MLHIGDFSGQSYNVVVFSLVGFILLFSLFILFTYFTVLISNVFVSNVVFVSVTFKFRFVSSPVSSEV